MPTPSVPVAFTPEQVARMHMALLSFIETVESTGGVDADTLAPAGDPEWIDLGEAYVEACNALETIPKTNAC